MRSLTSLLLCASLIISIAPSRAYAQPNEGVEPREIEISLDPTILITYESRAKKLLDENGQEIYVVAYNNSTYVPVRALCYLLGLNITWDNDRRIVAIEDSTSINIPEFNGNRIKTGVFRAIEDRSIAVTYNGVEHQLKDTNGDRVYPITYSGTTYLPVRYIGELLGHNIAWDSENRAVVIDQADFDLNNLFDFKWTGNSESQRIIKPGDKGPQASVADTGLYSTLYLDNSTLQNDIYYFDCSGFNKLDILAVGKNLPNKLYAINYDTKEIREITTISSNQLADYVELDYRLKETMYSLDTKPLGLYDIQRLFRIGGDTLDITGWNWIGFYSENSSNEIVIAYAHLYE